MINIFMSADKLFLWNAEDIIKLRKEQRIVGALAGIYPGRPFQIQAKWLPLQLMPEEARLLIDKGFAKLIKSPEKLTDPTLVKEYFEQRSILCEQQITLLKENRKKIIMEKADEIYEGKKRKFLEGKADRNKKIKSTTDLNSEESDEKHKNDCTLNETVESGAQKDISLNSKETVESSITDCSELQNQSDKNSFIEKNESISTQETDVTDSSDIPFPDISETMTTQEFLDKETVIRKELDKVSEVSTDLCMVQLFTESPWKNLSAVTQLNFPNTEVEKLRNAVFRDLWEKKFYVTSGLKFGGDFLAYKGDPLKYHASFIVVCIPRSSKIQAIDVLTYGRLGHQVKKTVALASTNTDGEVEYISVNWDSDL